MHQRRSCTQRNNGNDETSNLIAARFLIRSQPMKRCDDENGRTPFYLAALHENEMGIVKLFLNHQELDVDYLDIKGNNVLDYAMGNMHHGLAEEIAYLLM